MLLKTILKGPYWSIIFPRNSNTVPLTSRIPVLRHTSTKWPLQGYLCNLIHVSVSGATMFSFNIFCDMTLTVNFISHGSYVTLHAIVRCDTVKQNNMFSFDSTMMYFLTIHWYAFQMVYYKQQQQQQQQHIRAINTNKKFILSRTQCFEVIFESSLFWFIWHTVMNRLTV